MAALFRLLSHDGVRSGLAILPIPVPELYEKVLHVALDDRPLGTLLET